jgi:phosphatidylglycerophosphate synthase
MGKLFDGYWQSLKPLDVEEPIDVWVHRPLAFLFARLLLPTSVSPNTVTFTSIVFGLLAFAAMFSHASGHMVFAGTCVFLSAVTDCADGQLARMRGTSSALGRMLDGVADFIVTIVIVGGGAVIVLRDHANSMIEFIGFSSAIVITSVTGSFHTASYDHYKNLYLRFTHPKYGEAEDLETAEGRYSDRSDARSIWMRISWRIYLFYLRSQTNFIESFDPFTSTRLSKLPGYSPEGAAVYAKYNHRLMRLWRNWFGFGSLTFGFAVATALNCLDVYVVLRGTLLNCLYFGWMLPQQRMASQAAFAELGLRQS